MAKEDARGVTHDWVSGKAAVHQNNVIAMNVEYRELTGREFYLFTSRPGDGQTRCVFTDGVKHGYAAAEDHMLTELTRAKAWHQGYADQTAWLTDGGKTAAEAEHALTERRASQAANPYNEGATAATRDYITNHS